jgi:DNA polymerase-3 subunit gamma/tau
MIIERFFRIIAESKGLLALGSDGEFILTLSLFKMMEALQIKEIDMMIHTLEKELQGVQITMPATSPKVSEVITITEADIAPSNHNKTEEIPAAPVVVEKPHETVPEFNENIPAQQPAEETIAEEDGDEDLQAEETVVQASIPEEHAVSVPDPDKKRFDALVQKIFDRDFELGMCFETNIEFESFAEGTLTWSSTAQGEEKKQLITHWGVINMFVKELFGFETKILNIAKEQAPDPEEERKKKSDETVASSPEESIHPSPEEEESNASASMIEDIEMKSSCIAPEAGDTEAAKEKDPSSLLEEPMIKAAIELFNPKKVRIKRKS